jgi:hypothetical protein
MSADRIDVVIDRLVVDGLDLDRADLEELAPLITEELRRLAGTGGALGTRTATLLELRELSADEAADPRAIARALATRIAAALPEPVSEDRT